MVETTTGWTARTTRARPSANFDVTDDEGAPVFQASASSRARRRVASCLLDPPTAVADSGRDEALLAILVLNRSGRVATSHGRRRDRSRSAAPPRSRLGRAGSFVNGVCVVRLPRPPPAASASGIGFDAARSRGAVHASVRFSLASPPAMGVRPASSGRVSRCVVSIPLCERLGRLERARPHRG